MLFKHDINGLRAYAVLAVVIFHFNKDWLPGGFIGVDVFFVISGYLMTGIIFRNIDLGRFALSNFYLARANRIIPALSIVCISTLIAGLALLAPEELKTLGKHIAYSASFLSNIAYQSEAGYFDVASHDKWLLHTWSLSVEWQFYIIYPLIILLFKKFFGDQGAKASVLITAVISLILCVYLSYSAESDAFYDLSSRAWEMMAGGAAILFPIQLKQSLSKFTESSGLLIILMSVFLLNENVTWPGLYTLAPVAGAWLVITANQQKSFITNNLVIQKLGSWSYSIYLWHWPIFVICKTMGMSSTTWLLTGIVLSILFGYLSYTLIEQKIRFDKHAKGIKLATHPTVIIMALTTTLGLCIESSNGFPNRFPPAVRDTFLAVQPSPFREQCHSKVKYPIAPKDACTYLGDNITWAALGDSHAIELSYALAEILKEKNEGVRHYSFSGCVPSYKQNKEFNKCTEWLNLAVEDLNKRVEINSVLINFRYIRAFFGTGESSDNNAKPQITETQRMKMFWSLKEMIRDIASAKQHVYVMLPIPDLTERMPNILSNNYKIGQLRFNDIKGQSRAYFLNRSQPLFDFFAETTFADNVTLIDPTDVFCNEKTCYAVRNELPLYFDDDHPSIAAAKLMLAPIAKMIKNDEPLTYN
jgi:peptidoglycan/LPS O-acetylase OafA/YrhL